MKNNEIFDLSILDKADFVASSEGLNYKNIYLQTLIELDKLPFSESFMGDIMEGFIEMIKEMFGNWKESKENNEEREKALERAQNKIEESKRFFQSIKTDKDMDLKLDMAQVNQKVKMDNQTKEALAYMFDTGQLTQEEYTKKMNVLLNNGFDAKKIKDNLFMYALSTGYKGNFKVFWDFSQDANNSDKQTELTNLDTLIKIYTFLVASAAYSIIYESETALEDMKEETEKAFDNNDSNNNKTLTTKQESRSIKYKGVAFGEGNRNKNNGNGGNTNQNEVTAEFKDNSKIYENWGKLIKDIEMVMKEYVSGNVNPLMHNDFVSNITSSVNDVNSKLAAFNSNNKNKKTYDRKDIESLNKHSKNLFVWTNKCKTLAAEVSKAIGNTFQKIEKSNTNVEYNQVRVKDTTLHTNTDTGNVAITSTDNKLSDNSNEVNNIFNIMLRQNNIFSAMGNGLLNTLSALGLFTTKLKNTLNALNVNRSDQATKFDTKGNNSDFNNRNMKDKADERNDINKNMLDAKKAAKTSGVDSNTVANNKQYNQARSAHDATNKSNLAKFNAKERGESVIKLFDHLFGYAEDVKTIDASHVDQRSNNDIVRKANDKTNEAVNKDVYNKSREFVNRSDNQRIKEENDNKNQMNKDTNDGFTTDINSIKNINKIISVLGDLFKGVKDLGNNIHTITTYNDTELGKLNKLDGDVKSLSKVHDNRNSFRLTEEQVSGIIPKITDFKNTMLELLDKEELSDSDLSKYAGYELMYNTLKVRYQNGVDEPSIREGAPFKQLMRSFKDLDKVVGNKLNKRKDNFSTRLSKAKDALKNDPDFLAEIARIKGTKTEELTKDNANEIKLKQKQPEDNTDNNINN